MINFSKLAALAKATPKEMAQSTSADALAQEKLTRRAALRRIGMAGGMTVLGVLSIDELARVAARKLDEHEMTRGIAKDFKDAGVALAGPLFPSLPGNNTGCTGTCTAVCKCEYGIELASCGSRPERRDYPQYPALDWLLVYEYDITKWNYCASVAADDYSNCLGSC